SLCAAAPGAVRRVSRRRHGSERGRVVFCFFFNDTATTEIYTLSLHDALPIWHLVTKDSIPLLLTPWCQIKTWILTNGTPVSTLLLHTLARPLGRRNPTRTGVANFGRGFLKLRCRQHGTRRLKPSSGRLRANKTNQRSEE